MGSLLTEEAGNFVVVLSLPQPKQKRCEAHQQQKRGICLVHIHLFVRFIIICSVIVYIGPWNFETWHAHPRGMSMWLN